MPPRCAACPANMYADHSLRLAQEIVTKNFFLRLLRQKGKGGGKLRMIQNGGLAAGGKKIFFKLLRLGKLDKLFTHQIIKGNFPFPPPAQLQDFIYGCVTWTYIAKHFSKLDMRDFTVFRSYIMTVAKHLCIDALRKHKIEVLEEELTAEEIDGCTAIDEDCVFREVCAKDASQILMQCLSELREEYRDVLKLHYYHERKVREIAEVLHLSESNVKQRLARGRVLLAEKIKEKGMVYEEL